jgi:biotin carboxylase
MKTVVFIGSHKSGSSYEAIRAADAMGYYTVLLTNRPSYIEKRIDFPHAHSVRLCGLDDLSEISGAVERLVMEKYEIRAIVSFIDPFCLDAAKLSHRFGLKPFTQDAISAMLDKAESRELLNGTHYSPYYYIAHDPHLPHEALRKMPLVLKTPVSSGSKDVHLVKDPAGYEKAFQSLKKQFPDAPILAEKYIDGTQVLAETLTVDGKVHIAAIAEQEVLFTERFIITGYKMIPGDDTLRAAIREIVLLLGMRDGPCHLELRRGRGGWIFIEANPRISGGAMNSFIGVAYGFDLAAETLKLALGLEPCILPKRREETYLRYITVPEGGVLERVTGKNAAMNSPGVERVYVKPKRGSVLHPPVSMGHRYAYVIATGASAESAERRAKDAAEKIVFHIQP